MKKLKINLIIVSVSLLLFIGTVGLVISVRNVDKQTENTTALYTATVDKTDVTDTGEGIFARIYTKEYNSYLIVSSSVGKNIEMEEVRNLGEGQTIFFRIENKKIAQMNRGRFVDIASLRTDTKEIFSLEEYNGFIHIAARPARIAGIVMALLFLFVSLLFGFRIKKDKK